MSMTPEELTILKEAVKNMREGNLTDSEKVIFVIGIQAGLYARNDETIKEILHEVADICLVATGEVTQTFEN